MVNTGGPPLTGAPTDPAEFVLFDIGGLLVDVDERIAVARWTALGYDPGRFHAAFEASGAKPLGDLGEVDAEGMRTRVEQAAGRPVSLETLHDVWGAMVRWRPWVGEVLDALTVPYGVLSTIDPVHAAVLGPLPGADPVVYSCDIGAVKPDPRAYDAAIVRLPVAPGRVLYVDDRPENVAAGNAAGLCSLRAWDRGTLTAALGGLLR